MEDCIDPIERLQNHIQFILSILRPEDIELGCPLQNLATEMSPLDDGFRLRVQAVFELWVYRISEAFQIGQDNGKVRTDIPAKDIGTYIVATLSGARSLAKTANSSVPLRICMKQLSKWLDSLRPESNQT